MHTTYKIPVRRSFNCNQSWAKYYTVVVAVFLEWECVFLLVLLFTSSTATVEGREILQGDRGSVKKARSPSPLYRGDGIVYVRIIINSYYQ